MSEQRQAVKVGLFVLIAIALVAALLISFSRSGSLFTRSYRIYLELADASGLVEGAEVKMAGVPIGIVERVRLSADGKSVSLRLKIQKEFVIHQDARFHLDQAGFLGDAFVSVAPQENRLPLVEPEQTVRGEEALSIQQIARSASGLIRTVDETVQKINQVVTSIDEQLLSEQTLTNVTLAVSDRALTAMDSVDRVLRTNAPGVNAAVSNLLTFSTELNEVSSEFRLLILTNKPYLTASLSNIEAATVQLNQIFDDIQQGKGLAGALLKGEDLRQHVSLLASNLTVASSNLNNKGLWKFLWKPKPQ